MKRRRFRPGCVHHIYQRPKHGIVLFHTLRDFLVFLTIFFVAKEKSPVRILGVCPMIDHLHTVLEADRKEDMSAFVQDYTSKFVKEYDRSLDKNSGRLFTTRYGCAPKRNTKDARSAIAYVYNNAPERKLCERAIEYKWNLLAFAHSNHPFSQKIVLKKASPALRKSMNRVSAFHRSKTALGYAVLGQLFKGLDRNEVLQLTDFILATYCNVDFQRTISFYGSLETMIIAIDSNTGNDYNFKEEFVGYTDAVYARMGAMLRRRTGLSDLKAIMKLPESQRRELYAYLLAQGDFIPRQVEKYLQLPSSARQKAKK